MTVQEFNELKLLRKTDTIKSAIFNLHCLAIIKRRLLVRAGKEVMESLAHSVLLKFTKYVTDSYIPFPNAYINRCVDNYLSSLKKKKKLELGITQDFGYEQRFEDLELLDLVRWLKEELDEVDAYLVYAHYVEGFSELELAKELKMPYTAVRQRICRAKRKLKIKYKNDVTKLF